MPVINVPGVGAVQFPDDMSNTDIVNAIENDILKVKPKEPTFMERSKAALKRGIAELPESFEGIKLGAESGLGFDQAAERKLQEIKAAQAVPAQGVQGITFEDLENTYGKEGAIEALKKLPSYLSEQILQNAPSMAVPVAAGLAATPFTSPLGGAIAGIGAYGLQQFGQFMQRQAEQAETAKQLEPGKALATAAVTAPLGYFVDRLTLGMSKIPSKALGENIMAELAKRAGATVAGRAATGATIGIVAEAPTEVLEQMAERWQANLPLFDEKAIREYKEAAAGAAAVGGAAGATSRVLAGRPVEEAKPGPEIFTQAPAAGAAAPAPMGAPTPAGMEANRAEALRQEAAQLEQMRQDAIEQNRLDEAAALQLAIQDRQEQAQARARDMAGFIGGTDGNVAIARALGERRQAELDRFKAGAAAAEKQRLAEIEQIKQTTYSADPVQNEIVKRRLLSQLELPTTPAAPAVEAGLEEPAGLYGKREPLETEPQTKPRGVQKFEFTPEEQAEIKSVKESLAAINKDIAAAKAQKTSLFKALEGKLTFRPGSINLADIDVDKKSLRRLYNKEGKGALLEDMVEDGSLDQFLPPENRKLVAGQENPRFDSKAAIDHIAGKLRSGDYTSEIEAANLAALERQRDAAKAELEKLETLPAVNRELAARGQLGRTGREPSLQDLMQEAANAGVDVERVQEDVARQMPDATDAQYRGALYSALTAARSAIISESRNPDMGTDVLNPADFADVKNAKDLLERYIKVGQDKGLKELASLLLQSKRLKDVEVNFVKTGDTPKHADVAASLNANAIAVTHTDKTGSRIYYRADKPETFNESTLVHEVFHSMTEAALQRNPTLSRELVGLTREMYLGLRDFEQRTNKGTNKNLSDFWNIAVRDKPGEMLAYAVTSPSFRQVFSQMAANGRPFQSLSTADMNKLRVRKEKPTRPGEKPTAPKELTAWQRIVDFVRRLLGIAPVNQKKFEQALIDYQKNLQQHEAAQDLYNAQLKEYETISPLKGALDKYLKDLIADTEAAGVAMPQGEAVSEAAKQSWGERETPDSYGREQTLVRMYNRMRDAYDESFGPDDAYQAAYENATGPEKQILRQLKKDDLLGFDYPHQAIKAIIESPDAFDMSIPLKASISRLGNQYVVSSAIFGGKETAPKRTQMGADAMEILSGIGRQVKEPEPGYIQKVRQSWDNARDNPQASREAAYGSFRRFADQVETWSFSSDAALNNQIRREVMHSMAGNEQKIGTLLNTSLSQTAHSDAVANLFLMEGNIKYDPELNKWVGVKDDRNIINLSKVMDEIAEKNGLTKEEIELIAHTAFEARRTQGLTDFNANIDAQAEAMRAEAAATRAAGKAVAAHALSEKAQNLLAKKKVVSNMSPEQIQAGMQLFDMFPKLKEVAHIWNGIRENALNVMVETGLYTQEEAEMLLDVADYVPFYREEQIEEGKGPKEFLRSLAVQADKRLKGSSKPVNDIFDNMVRWTQYAINRGVRNRSGVALATTAEQLGLADKVEDARAGDNVVSVWQDGQRVYYNMADPLFMSAFRGLESVAIPTIKVFSKMADVLRQSVVLYPLFSIAQVPQDSFAAMFTSGLKPQYALSIPFRAVKEFVQTLRGKSKAHEELKNVGAVGVRDFTSSIIRNDVEIAAGLKKEKGLWEHVKRSLGSLAMAADNAVRQATYEAAMAQGLSRAEAIEKAFEIFNVRRRGNSKMLALAGQVIPFFNAYLAAQHVAYRTLTGVGTSPTERKAAFQTLAATTGSVMALSLLYAMMNGDDEDYLNKPTPTRDRLLMIPGSGGFSIPLRADLFALPKVLAEHTYLLLTDNGYEDGAKFRSSIASLLANSIFSPTPVPQAIKPLTEAIINYDFFQQKPLVGVFQQKKELGRQFEDSTSEISKLLGKTGMVSPIVADHLIRGMFGSFGGAFMYMTNPVLADMSGTPRPELSMQDALATIPNASGFVSKEYESALRKDFYALKEVTDRAAATMSDLKQRSPQEIADYLSDETTRQRVALAPAVNQIATKLTNIRKAVTAISQAPEERMTEEDKQREIKRLREAERKVLEGVNLKRLREMANL